MRLYNHLKESENTDIEIIYKILSNCKPFLTDLVKDKIVTTTPYRFLLSGRKETPSFIKRKVLMNRKPKDTPIEVHEYVDKLFKKYFGYKARSQSIFCTSDYERALYYGKPFAIFPIGDYSFIYNPTINDMISIIDTYPVNKNVIITQNSNEILQELGDITTSEYEKSDKSMPYNEFYLDIKAKYFEKIVDEISKEHKELNDRVYEDYVKTCRNKHLNNALKSQNEIMIHCKEYYGVEFGGSNIPFYIYKYLQEYGVSADKKKIENIIETGGLYV